MVVVLLAAIALNLGVSVYLMAQGGIDIITGLAALLLSVGLPVWILFGTHYRIDAEQLKVQSGPFRWKIALKDIENVEATRNLLSSPALSLDRLMIHYQNGQKIMVSPKDKEGFIAAIQPA